MEVLICIFIMAVGLASIASLLPVGGLQVQKANIEERKAELGQNAFREFEIRGLHNPLNWARYDSANSKWIQYDGAAAYLPPLAIDPFMIGAVVSNNPSNASNVQAFPAMDPISSGMQIPRLTVAQACAISGSAPNITITPNKMLAENICSLVDDLVVDQPDDASQPAQASFVMDSSSPPKPVKRQYVGDYSWLATLAPYYADQLTASPMNQFMLSVVVFNKRLLTVPTATSKQEDIVNVTSMAAGTVNIGGGDITITGASVSGPPSQDQIDMARPGTWLMLCRLDDTGTTKVCKWYRIIAASTDDSSGTNVLQVTLNGPDWVWGNPTNRKTYACLFDGAVAVYQRVIHLEGPSQW